MLSKYIRDCNSAIKPINIHIMPVIEKKTASKGKGVNIKEIM